MYVATTVARARALCADLPRPLGFIPTMGALHGGHFELVRCAGLACASRAASVFVNPLQFAPDEDLDRYPRDAQNDRLRLEQHGVDVLFAPAARDVYPKGFSTSVDPGPVGAGYEGASRPSHFSGVATIIVKLLDIVRPDVLYVGQKDAQQSAVIRRIVHDLDIPVRVEIVPVVRDADGLALSSRNIYLNAREREDAASLHRAVLAVRDAMTSGVAKDQAIRAATAVLSTSAVLDYLDVVDADSFEPIGALRAGAFIVAAARFGKTRLLDNVWIQA
ncbi:MAG: pantoate--beta-alanine ligase [Candidatus Eremiobacteraeota bacterium]|nr:pantoate--beta-alanine ligase [Candidatus Eremiobacteraeota bacterium]